MFSMHHFDDGRDSLDRIQWGEPIILKNAINKDTGIVSSNQAWFSKLYQSPLQEFNRWLTNLAGSQSKADGVTREKEYQGKSLQMLIYLFN